MNFQKLTEHSVSGFQSEPVFVAPGAVNYFMASKPGQVGKTILTLTGGGTLAAGEAPEEIVRLSGFQTFLKASKRDSTGPKELDGLPVWINMHTVRVVRPDRGRKLLTLQFVDGSQLHVNELSEFA